MANGKLIQLENRTEDIWLFNGAKVTVGAAPDRTTKGPRDPRYQPDPVVKLTQAELDAWNEHDRRTLDHLVKAGSIERREVSA